MAARENAMGRCGLCDTVADDISARLGVCRRCVGERPEEALTRTAQAHRESRATFRLPTEPPRAPTGVGCKVCMHECRIPEDGVGYCGVRRNVAGKISGVTTYQGKLSWYHDPLPTNCVADWVCAGGTGAGYPKYARCRGPEVGYTNLAVFFHACSFNCLGCQNWHFRHRSLAPQTRTVHDLVADVDDKTSCICYFGGDPAPQLPFSLRASRLALRRTAGRILRICWETNGAMNERLLDNMTDLALQSGGCIKFDLKARNDDLHRALTGVSNHRTLRNFARVGKKIARRSVPPLLTASTLLVPGYVTEREIHSLARFVAALDPQIPYSLLAFAPHFHMVDMPRTPRHLAEESLAIAREAGLTRVRLGNVNLLA